MKKRVLPVLVSIVLVGLLLLMLPNKAKAADSHPDTNEITVNGVTLSDSKPYYVNGASAASSSQSGWNVWYNKDNGHLMLNNYNGGRVSINGDYADTVMICICGTNYIDGAIEGGALYIKCGDVRIEDSVAGTTSGRGKLTISGEYAYSSTSSFASCGIVHNCPSSSQLLISGDVDLNIDWRGTYQAFGIYTIGKLIIGNTDGDYILDTGTTNVSVNVVSGDSTRGISAGSGVYISATGSVKVAAMQLRSGSGSSPAYGIYSSGIVTLDSECPLLSVGAVSAGSAHVFYGSFSKPSGYYAKTKEGLGYSVANYSKTDTALPVAPGIFPDFNFMNVMASYDTDGNGYLNSTELSKITSISASSKDFLSLKGVEFLTSLTNLSVTGTSLRILELTDLTKLKTLSCYGNTSLTTLTLDNLPLLQKAELFKAGDDYDGNDIRSLDFTDCDAIEEIYCQNNENLSSLTFDSHNKNLKTLYCYGTNLTTLDIGDTPHISGAYAYGDHNAANYFEEYQLETAEDTYTLRVDGTTKITHIGITVLKQPSDQSVSVGNNAVFSAGLSCAGRYQCEWYVSKDGGTTYTKVNADKYPSAATEELTFEVKATMDGYMYKCRAYNDAGEIYTNAATLSVAGMPKITTQPSNKSAAVGAQATFKVVATGSSLTYQWQVSKDGGSTWKNISTTTYPSAATATLKFTVKRTMNGYKYRCVVSNSLGSVKSSGAKLTVTAKPTITTQPSNSSGAAGASATFKVVAAGSSLTYQWQVSKDGGSTWKNISTTTYPSAATATLKFTIKEIMNGYQYRCVVSNAAGSVNSSSATLTVITKPTITTQPSNKTVTAGSQATFKVVASGSGLTYQWQVSKDGGTTWTNVNTTKYPSAATATLKFETKATMNGYKYRCVVTNSAGSVNSSSAALTVN